MTVRCEQCGHENDVQYHFCGMCGSPLRSPAALAVKPTATTTPVALVPSFLGLTDEPKRDLNYLLEDDDEPSSRRWLYIVAVLLLALGGGAAWYWWSGAWPWEARGSAGSAASSQATPTPSATVTPPVEPSSSQEPSGNTAAVAPPAAGNQAMAPAPPAGDKQAVPAPTASAPATDSEDKAASQTTAAPDASSSPTGATSEAPSAAPAPEEVKATPPPPKVRIAKARPAAVPANPEDKLVSDGERYLYGNGVAQDCDRAQKNLVAAARHTSSKAYTLLGAMYATGHCVTRDLPTAYRWFARALHQDPGNTRLQQNLEVVWKQMTPEEQRVAMRPE
jgi:hypothetical protein